MPSLRWSGVNYTSSWFSRRPSSFIDCEIAGILWQEVVNLVVNMLNIDNALDVFAVHGIGGISGTLMIAFFGYAAFITQLSVLAMVGIFTFIMTYVLNKIMSLFTPLRVDKDKRGTVLF